MVWGLLGLLGASQFIGVLRFRGWGFKGLGFRVLGFRDWGFRVLGFRVLGFGN